MSYCEWDDPLVYNNSKQVSWRSAWYSPLPGETRFPAAPKETWMDLIKTLVPKPEEKKETMFVVASKYDYYTTESFGVTDEKFETYEEALEECKKLLAENRDEIEAYIFEHKATVKRQESFTVDNRD